MKYIKHDAQTMMETLERLQALGGYEAVGRFVLAAYTYAAKDGQVTPECIKEDTGLVALLWPAEQNLLDRMIEQSAKNTDIAQKREAGRGGEEATARPLEDISNDREIYPTTTVEETEARPLEDISNDREIENITPVGYIKLNKAKLNKAKLSKTKLSKANDIPPVLSSQDTNVSSSESTPPKGKSPQKQAKADDVPEDFNRFWSAYPKKAAKQAAVKAWRKLEPSPELADEIIHRVAVFAATKKWREDDGQFIPYPATFLNGRRWEDEIGRERAAPGKDAIDEEMARLDREQPIDPTRYNAWR